jgi:arginine decarboxylase
MNNKKVKSAPYYNIAQLRTDYWNDLKRESIHLSRSIRSSAKEKKHKQLTLELLDDLLSVECFFSFPGISRVESLKSGINREEYTTVAHQVTEFTRQLISDSYRKQLDNPDDKEIDLDASENREQHDESKRNIFDVLFVERYLRR